MPKHKRRIKTKPNLLDKLKDLGTWIKYKLKGQKFIYIDKYVMSTYDFDINRSGVWKFHDMPYGTTDGCEKAQRIREKKPK